MKVGGLKAVHDIMCYVGGRPARVNLTVYVGVDLQRSLVHKVV